MRTLTLENLTDFIKTTSCEYYASEDKPNLNPNTPIRLFDVRIFQGSDMPVLCMKFAFSNEREEFNYSVKSCFLKDLVDILGFVENSNSHF